MSFIEQTALGFLLLWAALSVFLRGRIALIGTSAGVASLLWLRQLPLWTIVLTFLILCCGILLEIPVRSWARRRDPTALLKGLVGSCVLILFFGIFFGPVASVIGWLFITGLKVLPELKASTGRLPYLANTLLRGILTLSMLAIGLYGIYA